MSALSSGVFFSKITSQSRAEASQPIKQLHLPLLWRFNLNQHLIHMHAFTGIGSDDPLQLLVNSEGGFPQNVHSTNPTSYNGVEEHAHYYFQADPPATIGEGVFFSKCTLLPCTTAAGVVEHYYSLADPPTTVGEGDSPQYAHSNSTSYILVLKSTISGTTWL